ncbi:MAG: riboflavin biosynthesis protein RibD [Candidatus Woykebacteria bacterium RIFCSPLOWO2_01_FULL_43_14]|uniref:Riboflavin biosynthesis protein RibD n=1 Tax=Candidatus Woykebacteria bacterium RIFCSPLOWO2_01_FULL_43_14 TaxID=1802605 RepID=A0A1G1WYG1_9BACT|nr:MAG: riboflavin biosynthesis protein RibD [Candidatus Woykebacteria bacterium RIFCSPLOWO2_01_FULL_43_14]
MRKIILFNLITLDGFFAGPNGELDWHNVDDEFNKFAIEQLGQIDTLIFGRVTYELMAGFWPTEQGKKDDPAVAEAMNSLPKIVYSKTLDKLEWENCTLRTEIDPEEINSLKSQLGKTIAIFGSANLAASFIKLGLIDEFRLLLNPVALGEGRPLFREPLKLRLLKTREFKNGNVLISYQPV